MYGADGQPEKTTHEYVRKVVIDPGHGGKDPGTVHQTLYEKDIVLSVALKLGKMIEDNFADVEVIYTRNTDVYHTVDYRGKFANKMGADLFISIHVNSAENSSARGVETYVMGASKSDSNLSVVMRENDVIVFEEDYSTKYQGYVPGSEESYIIFSLMQYAYQDQSMQLAELMQKHLVQDVNKVDRGAKQDAFLVLWNTAMPSVLTEIGFISNAEDRKYMNSEEGKNKIATALFNAFSEYKAKVEGRSGAAALQNGGNGEAEPAATVAQETCVQPDKDAGIRYFVQLAVLDKPKSTSSPDFKSYRGKVAEQRTLNGKYRYVVGGVRTYAEAVALLEGVKKEFKDAFIMALDGQQHINVSDARRKTDN